MSLKFSLMKRKFLTIFLSILALSVIISLMLTFWGKYSVEAHFYRKPFFHYFIYYIVLVFFIQIIACFWVVYILDEYLINKKINFFIISIFSGLFTFLIMNLLAYLKFEAYYFEPFKHNYQLISFFFVGFFYPYISKYLKYSIL